MSHYPTYEPKFYGSRNPKRGWLKDKCFGILGLIKFRDK